MQLVTGPPDVLVNAEHRREIYDKLQTLRIKHSILN